MHNSDASTVGSFLSALTHWVVCLYRINMKTLLSNHYWYHIMLIYQGYHITDIISHYTDIIPYDYTILIAHHTDIAAHWCAILISCNLVLLSYRNGITSDINHIILPRLHTILISSRITLIFYQYWILSRNVYPFHAIIKSLAARGQENYCQDHDQWCPYSLYQQAITSNGIEFIRLIYWWTGGG